MDTKAFDALLFMTGLAQLRDPQRISTLYLEGLESLFPQVGFAWLDSVSAQETHFVEVCTRSRSFGFIRFGSNLEGFAGGVELLHNTAQLVAVILDRTRQEMALEERTRLLEKSRASSEAFSYTVSHDLRTPLRAIDGFAHILREDFEQSLPQEGIATIDRILAAVSRMTVLIEAILSLSKLDRCPVVELDVDVERIFREVFLELEAAGFCRECPGCDWRDSLARAKLPSIRSDPALCRQVLMNIVGNACKFTREGACPRIEMGCESRQDGIWISVADNGCGFDMAYSRDLFRPFARFHSGNVEGAGIGLATVRKILDVLGGAIEMESREGHGSVFRLRLEPSRSVGVAPEADVRS